MSRPQALFAFVDPKDPFMAGDVAGEEQPGPILSIMSAIRFELLFLFHTPHTRANLLATTDEVRRRHPECKVSAYELPVPDPKDYSSLMAGLARQLRDLKQSLAEPSRANVTCEFPMNKTDLGKVREFEHWMEQTLALAGWNDSENYVCVSSGTAEMRAAWFILTATGYLPAKLLQVGSPARPLFGAPNVKEVLLDMSDWRDLRRLMLPMPRARRLHDEFTAQEPRRINAQIVLAGPRERQREPVPGLDEALQELGIFIGSAMMRNAAERAAIAADSTCPVLLLGETGTGKERFANLIHRLSPRHDHQFLAINCASIPEELAESYLFGHVKGAFTGAGSDKRGVFEDAHHTTLFLDEITELTLEIQAKFLRVLQDGVVQRVGSTASRKVDVRIIAATNRDLLKEIKEGRFRDDLYYRLEVVPIKLPPLRERRNEIPELAVALLQRINQQRKNPRRLSTDALRRLEGYHWPGNVRQLMNVLERSVLFAQSDVLGLDDLIIADAIPPPDLFAGLPEPVPGFDLPQFVDQIRKQLVLRAMEQCNNNQTEAAKLLGVTKQAVSQFLSQFRSSEVVNAD
jgi:DNA-binding NtrC family response regulator